MKREDDNIFQCFIFTKYRFYAVHKHSRSHRFPTMLWDSLPHGGASQVHPHIHATLHSDHYYGFD